MRAHDVMRNPVITLRPGTPVHVAAAMLVSHGFTAAPVVTAEGELLGMVTEADLVRGWMVPAGDRAGSSEPSVASVMRPAPIRMHAQDDLVQVVAHMLDSGERSVLIVEHGHLVGIVTARDVLRVVAQRRLILQDVVRERTAAMSEDCGA